jgi:hypothetical protein
MSHDKPARSNEVPGYRPVLCRQETKSRLQQFGKALPDSGFVCERRVATAAIELALQLCAEQPEYRDRLIALIPQIAQQDQDSLRDLAPHPLKTQDGRPKTPQSTVTS